MSQEIEKRRVVCFGDSTTAARENVDIYVDQLQRRFVDMGLINRGCRGDTTNLARKRFASDVLAVSPQIVVIQFGINDAAVDVWKDPAASSSRVDLDQYSDNLHEFVRSIREVGAQALLLTSNQVRWTDPLLRLYGKPPYRKEDEKGFTFILENYAEATRKVARIDQVPLVDIYALYDDWETREGRSCSELLIDGMHPNTFGHRLVADQLAIAFSHFNL